MPSANTLSIKPIREIFDWYSFGITVDPFARNCELCEFTNDLNPTTKAKSNMFALDFIISLPKMNFVVFDPPFTLRQVKECYESVGAQFLKEDSQNAIRWSKERNAIAEKQNKGDRVMSLGYTSVCMGKKRGYKILEICLVAHGPAHNDTIVTVEEKE